MTDHDEDPKDETELQSDPSWDYYHQFLKERDKDPASSFEGFLEKVPESFRDKVRKRIQDLEFAESLLSDRRTVTELPRIDGFEMQRSLGRGGTGQVFLARRVSDDRLVALKVFRSQPIFEKRARTLFAREVKAIESLDHESIGGIIDRDPTGQGQWIAMEYIDGVSLSAEIKAQKRHAADSKERSSAGCVLPSWQSGDYVRRVAFLMLDLAKALAHAHKRGVYHRDLKPGNVLIRNGNRAVLVDFGLAKIVEEESRTGVGDLLGTLGYMSPEQILARRVPIDFRTDFWSLGVTFYEVLALHRPFEGESYEEVHRQVCFEEPQPLQRRNPRVPQDLVRILDRCLQKNPRHRFDSADEIVLHLEEFLQHRKSSLPGLPLSHRLKIGWKRHRILASTGLLACLLLVAIAGTSIWSRALAHEESVQTAHARLVVDLGEWDEQGLESLPGEDIRKRMERVQESLVKFEDNAEGSGKEILGRGKGEGGRRLSLGRKLLAEGALSGSWNPKNGKIPDPVMVERGKELVEAAGLILHGDRSRFDAEIESFTQAWMTIHRPEIPGQTGKIRVRQSYWVDKACAFTKPVDFEMEFGEPFTLPAGIYRFEILVEGYGCGEFVRRMTSPGEQQELRPRILETKKVIANGMSLIEGGDCTVGGQASVYPYRRHRIRLPSYYMDTHEVTVREFLTFMKATGCPPPFSWLAESKKSRGWERYLPQLTEEWADHPITQVSIHHARAYAEWAGKRLPTAWEWERAARGKEGKEYFWGDWSQLISATYPSGMEFNELSNRYALQAATSRIPKGSQLVRPLMMLHPVGSFEADQTVEGIFDLLGNAMELTESPTLQTWSRMDPATFRKPNILIASRTSYLIKGSSVTSMRSRRIHPQLSLSLYYFTPSQGNNFGTLTGFRCVKSIPR